MARKSAIRLARVALFILFATGASGATITVTTTADSGPESLRQALLDAASGACAAPCTVDFAIPDGDPEAPPTRWHRIAPQTPLPNLTAPGTTVDATTQTALADTNPIGPEVALDGLALSELSGLRLIGCDGCAVRGLAIFGFPGHGVLVQDSRDARVEGSWLGFISDGGFRGNQMDAVAIVRSTGTIVRASLLSNNGSNGAYITGSAGTILRDNRIGTTFGFDVNFANAANGVHIHDSSDTLVEENVIAFNRHHGINVTGDAQRNDFTRNRIHSNRLLGIDLGGDARDPIDPGDPDEGPNARTNAPVVDSFEGNCSEATIRGRLDALPSTTYRIEVFSVAEPDVWGTGEGNRYLGAADVTTNGSGTAEWSVVATDDLDRWITATATAETGSTSEFSAAMALEDPLCADLSVEIATAGFRPIPAGEDAFFTVWVRNGGSVASGPRELSFRIDAGTLVDAIPGCVITPQEARCGVPPLAESSATFHFRIRTPMQTTTVTATATVEPSEGSPDPNTSNDTDTATIEVTTLPDLRQHIPVSFEPIDPGTEVQLRVNVENEGSGTAEDVVLTIETAPAIPLRATPLFGSRWTCNPTSRGVRCTIPALAGGENSILELSFQTPTSGRVPGIEFRTELTSPSGDFDPDGNVQEFRLRLYRARFVTNLDESGFGSLRQAMIDVQEPDCDYDKPCKVIFRVPSELAVDGVFTIRPSSPLPTLRQGYVTVDGFSQALFTGDTNSSGPEIEIDGSLSTPGSGITIDRAQGVDLESLAINGWDGHGVEVGSGQSAAVQNGFFGLFIGTDPTGTKTVPNRGHGIYIRDEGQRSWIRPSIRCIGAWRPGCGSALLIGGNEGDGIRMEGADLQITDARIGTAISGLPLPNGGNGITFAGASGGAIRSSWIAQNAGDGIRLLDDAGAAYLDRTAIRANGELGIDLGADGVTVENVPRQEGLNAPEIVSATFDPDSGTTRIETTVSGLEPAEPDHFREIVLFASDEPDPSGYGEGAEPLRIVFRGNQPAADGDLRGKWITAVLFEFYQPWPDAPRQYRRMSEFGKAFQVPR